MSGVGLLTLVLGLSIALIISNVTMMVLLGRGPEVHTGLSRLIDMCGYDPAFKDKAARLLYSPHFRQQDERWKMPVRREPYRIFDEDEPASPRPATIAHRGVPLAECPRSYVEKRCNPESKIDHQEREKGAAMAPVSAFGRNVNVMYF